MPAGLERSLTRLAPHAMRLALLGLAVWFAVVLAYAGYVNDGTVSRDQWEFLLVLDRFLSGNMDWGQLWQSHSEHVKPGYKLLFLLNGKYLGLNLMLEIWAGLLLLGLTVWVATRALRRSFADATGPVWICALTLFTAGAVLMSFNQGANYTYSLLALGGFGGTLLQLSFMAGFSRALREEVHPAWMAGLALLGLLAVLGFAGARSPAMAGACAAALVLAWWLAPAERRRLYRTALPLLALAFLAIALYLFLLYSHNDKVQRVGRDFSAVLTQPVGAVAYVSRMLAESQFDIRQAVHFVDGNLLHTSYALMGYTMLGWSLWRYFAGRLWQKSWLPFLLIMYSALFALEVLLGRYGMGREVDDAVAPRYVFDSHLWIVGVVWIAGLEWSRQKAEDGLPRWRRAAPAALFGVVLVTEAMNAGGTLLIAPYQARNQVATTKALEAVMTGQGTFADSPRWVCPHEKMCGQGIAIMEQYRLNVARDLPVQAPAAVTAP